MFIKEDILCTPISIILEETKLMEMNGTECYGKKN